jgi:hypothetical protein
MNIQKMVIITVVPPTTTMSPGSMMPWDSLETRRATAFLIAGGLWLADTILLSIELFAGISILGTPGAVNPVLFISGTVAAIVGMLGLYPELADWTPRLARVSAGLVAVAGVAIGVILVWFVTVTLLNRPDPPGALLILSLLVAALGFILFGIAAVRTDVPSRTDGVLVLGLPATIVGGVFLAFVVYGGDSPDWTSPAIGLAMSALLLSIGVRLRTADTSTGRSKPARDTTAK